MAKILPIIFAMAVFGWGHCPQSITDPRDGNVYRTAEAPSGHCWFAENVRYKKEDNDKVEGGTRSENDGETYSWKIATGFDPRKVDESGYTNGPYITKNSVCPPGWHVSTSEEWNILMKMADYLTYDFLSTTGWQYNGTNKFGLDIKNAPIKYWYRDVPDHSIGPTYWTSSYRGSTTYPNAIRFDDGYTGINTGFTYNWESAFYVRCVQDRKQAKQKSKIADNRIKSCTVIEECIDFKTGQKYPCERERMGCL